jgi:hypothetical protein
MNFKECNRTAVMSKVTVVRFEGKGNIFFENRKLSLKFFLVQMQ